MKYSLILLFFMSSFYSLTAQVVEFEDENFKAFIISEGYDDNEDGEIQLLEAEEITNLNIFNSTTIESIIGIKEFVNLRFLDMGANVDIVDVSNMPNLEFMNISGGVELSTINASGCPNLESFDYHSTISSIDSILISDCPLLTDINLSDSNFAYLDLENNIGLSFVNIYTFNSNTNTVKINFNNCVNIETLWLHGDFDILDLSDLVNLVELDLLGDFNDIILDELPKLKNISLDIQDYNGHINLDNLPALEELTIYSISMQSLTARNCAQLKTIMVHGMFGLVDFSGCSSLLNVDVNNVRNFKLIDCVSLLDLTLLTIDDLDSLDLSGAVALKNLEIDGMVEYMNFDGCHGLEFVSIHGADEFSILDFSSCFQLSHLYLGTVSSIHTLILQNSASETVEFDFITNIENLCVDPDELESISELIINAGVTVTNLTTTCDYANGGRPFIIKGKSILDINSDDCASSDVLLPYSKYVITDSLENESFFFSKSDGSYIYGVSEGSYTYKPDVLYGNDLFTLSPLESSVSFPSAGTEVNVDFCFRPGLEVDIIEVTLIPLDIARPGFDASYLITYKNTGNVTRSGDIKLTFQDEFLDLVYSDPEVGVQEEGFLSWPFEDLIPYETRRIEFSMNLNSPMEDPALIGGEFLAFEAMVGPLGNQTVSSYWSDLKQEVVNSFDPNDKTCLNGDVLDESMIGDFVKYMIRFENTGTADAVNIVVTDTIDHTKFDIRTLEVLNASHDVLAEVEGNTVDFIFKDIYLPFEDATNDGYVTFKIKTLETLALGDNLQNRAGIYFDFNFPIITNTTSTVITDVSAITDINLGELDVEISPNPADQFVNIASSENLVRVDLYNVSGILIKHVDLRGNSPTYQLITSELSKGTYQIRIQSRDNLALKTLVKL